MNEAIDYEYIDPDAVPYVSIPLRLRGVPLEVNTLVDAADAAWVNQWPWHINQYGYAYRSPRVDGVQRCVFLHRLILGLTPGDGLQGDHINRDRLDNRRSNLRVAPAGMNQQNRRSYVGSTSRYRGVCWHIHRKAWMASLQQRGKKTLFLGYFDDEHEAGMAAQAARLRELPYAVD